ncbi:FAS1 domain-containing protein, partial [Glonium stellatum]
MKFQLLLALLPALTALAAPIASAPAKRDVADVATVLIGVGEKRDTADVATVLIGVADRRDVLDTATARPEKRSTDDVATVLIGVSEREVQASQGMAKREPAVEGAYARYVKAAEAHPKDILADSSPSFSDVLSSHKNLTTFKNTLQSAYPDLLSRLDALTLSSPVTVLAPSNNAFAKTTYYPVLGPAFDNYDLVAIQNILNYHVLNGSHASKDLITQFQFFPTWLNNATFSNVTNGQRVGGVMQGSTDMIWLSGESTRSSVSEADIPFAGGVIHIIETMVMPPTSFPATAETFSTASEPFEITAFLGATYFSKNNTIPALAAFLNQTADLTIFAPNNAALESVATALTSLADNDPTAFTKLLDYHIVASPSGPIFSTNLTNGTTLTTLTGATLSISMIANSRFVNAARILTPDVLIANGVVHVLDNVLSPDDTTSVPQPTRATQLPVLSADSQTRASEAPFTSFMPWDVVTQAPAATGSGKAGTLTGTAAASTKTAGAGRAVGGGV